MRIEPPACQACPFRFPFLESTQLHERYPDSKTRQRVRRVGFRDLRVGRERARPVALGKERGRATELVGRRTAGGGRLGTRTGRRTKNEDECRGEPRRERGVSHEATYRSASGKRAFIPLLTRRPNRKEVVLVLLALASAK